MLIQTTFDKLEKLLFVPFYILKYRKRLVTTIKINFKIIALS